MKKLIMGALIAALLFIPAPVHAAGRTSASDVIIQSSTTEGAVRLIDFVDQEGKSHILVTRTVPAHGGTLMFFTVADTRIQAAAQADRLRTSTNGFRRLSRTSWVYWNDRIVDLYISHADCQRIVLGSAFLAAMGVVISLLPLGKVAGAMTEVFWGLTAATVAYLDWKGEPGFHIMATRHPPRVWIKA